MKIILNAGHHLADEGAKGGKLIESKMAMILRDMTASRLTKLGYKVFIVPDELDIIKSVEWEKKHADETSVSLDIHFDSFDDPTASGTTAYFFRNEVVAATFARCVSKELGIRNRGAKMDNQSQHERLAWCRDTKGRAVVLECCYLSSPEDMAKFSYEKCANGIVNAIKEIESPIIIEVDKKEIVSFLQYILKAIQALFSSKKLGSSQPAERSLTIKASWINIIVAITAIAGVQLTGSDIDGFLVVIGAAITIVSSLVAWLGRVRAGGVKRLQ